MPEHKIPQEQPMTVNSYTDNSGGNAPPTQPVASPQGVKPTAFIEAPMIKDQDERIKVLIADVAKLSTENERNGNLVRYTFLCQTGRESSDPFF